MCCIIMLLMAVLGVVLIPVLITQLWNSIVKIWNHWEVSSIAINLCADFVILLLFIYICPITLSTELLIVFPTKFDF